MAIAQSFVEATQTGFITVLVTHTVEAIQTCFILVVTNSFVEAVVATQSSVEGWTLVDFTIQANLLIAIHISLAIQAVELNCFTLTRMVLMACAVGIDGRAADQVKNSHQTAQDTDTVASYYLNFIKVGLRKHKGLGSVRASLLNWNKADLDIQYLD